MLYDVIAGMLHTRKMRKQWRERNTHNGTVMHKPFDMETVRVDRCTYGILHVENDVKERTLHIGSYCSIAAEVVFLLGCEHKLNTVSSFPFRVKCLGTTDVEAGSKGDITVGDDVWIGRRCLIMSGVKIGQGAVIAAGSIVASDVPPYAIVGGNPARIIRYRHEQSIIDFLLTLDFERLDDVLVKDHAVDLYRQIDGMDVEDIKRLYSWFPKKEPSK